MLMSLEYLFFISTTYKLKRSSGKTLEQVHQCLIWQIMSLYKTPLLLLNAVISQKD